MAAVGQHEGAALAIEFCGLITTLPWRDVVADPSHDVAVDIDLAHVGSGQGCDRRRCPSRPTGLADVTHVMFGSERGIDCDLLEQLSGRIPDLLITDADQGIGGKRIFESLPAKAIL